MALPGVPREASAAVVGECGGVKSPAVGRCMVGVVMVVVFAAAAASLAAATRRAEMPPVRILWDSEDELRVLPGVPAPASEDTLPTSPLPSRIMLDKCKGCCTCISVVGV